MTKMTKIVAVVAIAGGILALTLGGIALAAEPGTGVCDGTGAKARLNAQDGTCGAECLGEPLGTMNQQRLMLQTEECDGVCEEPLQTQTRTHNQLMIQDGTCSEDGAVALGAQQAGDDQLQLKDGSCGLECDGTPLAPADGSGNQYGKTR